MLPVSLVSLVSLILSALCEGGSYRKPILYKLLLETNIRLKQLLRIIPFRFMTCFLSSWIWFSEWEQQESPVEFSEVSHTCYHNQMHLVLFCRTSADFLS